MALELKVDSTEVHGVHELAGRELVCELRKTSMVLYGMFVELVREFYRYQTPYVIGVPGVRWNPDHLKTEIWVDSELNWNAAHPEFLPAVYVKLGDIAYGSPYGEGGPVHYDINLRDALYTDARKGSVAVSFVHVGGTAGEACALCDNTRAYLSDFSAQIRKDFVLSKFSEVQASPLRQAQPDSKERWQSVSTFQAEWIELTTLKLESPILRDVDLIPSISADRESALHDFRRYGILSVRRRMPDQHLGEKR